MDSLDVVIERLRRVDWQTQTARRASRVALMREFLRRTALYAEAYGRSESWPFFDIAASVEPATPDVPLPEQLEALLLPARVLQTLRWMLKWAASPRPLPPELPDPYEPLLLFFERGGGFTVENRMVDVDSAGIPIRDRQRYSSAEPFVVLDPAALDALDRQPAPGAAEAAPAVAAEQASAAPAGATPPGVREAWRRLLAEPEGPERMYEVTLSLARRFARELPPGNRSVLLAGVPEALAARVVLAGPHLAQSFSVDAGRLVAAVAAQLGGTPSASYGRAAFTLLTLQRIAEACGALLQLPRFQPSAWPPELLSSELISDEERLLLALLTIDAGGPDGARALLRAVRSKPASGGAPDSLASWVAELAAALTAEQPGAALQQLWRDLLHVFPSWLPQRKAEWRHLLVAARIIFGRSGIPLAQVAAELHRQALALAGAPSGAA